MPDEHEDQDKMITLTVAAKAIGVARYTLLRHARQGTLRVIKRGTRNYTTLEWAWAWKNDPTLHLPGNPKLRKSHN